MAKRVLDVAAATVALFLTLPILVVTTIAIWISMGPPPLFRQQRAGYHGRTFTLFKFRTMQGPSIAGRESLDDAVRLTPMGRFLRRTSVDELPQLLNVLRGEMSLVGPRPLLVDYLPHYSPTQARRHEVKPGITGWTQVCGRNSLNWNDKFELDVWYVDHWSIGLDIRILLLTVQQVLLGRGVSSTGHVTMARFDGNERHE
ncbi:MAG TPA: sugar transferase [Thermomicrobiales bacterium]|nr:sugar transferase [Thermomicrobiales bacterium]